MIWVKLLFVWLFWVLNVCFVFGSEKNFKLSEVVQNYPLPEIHLGSGEDHDFIRIRFEEYERFRLGHLSNEGIQKILDQCSSPMEFVRSPFCPLMKTLKKGKKKLKIKIKMELKAKNAILRAIATGKIALLEEFNEDDVSKLLLKIKNDYKINILVKNALRQTQCISPSILTSLAMRAEVGFPKNDVKNKVMELYQKAIECGSGSSVLEASYRLGLIQIWNGQCGKAEQVLVKISGEGISSAYRVRALFWRLHCATQLNQIVLRDQLKTLLLGSYPLTLHQLIVRLNSIKNEDLSIDETDPIVRFRSKGDFRLNGITQAVEILLSHEQYEAASELMELNVEQVQLLESSFQLYWAFLFKQAKNQTSSFQLMANIFKTNSAMIARPTLGLMYPLFYSDLLKKSNSSIDPLFILALVRQESGFNPQARSPARAFGLMQLQLNTARRFRKISQGQLYNPQINIQVGSQYLDSLLKRYEGEADLALAAYNAGPQRLKQLQKRYPIENRLLFFDLLPLKETRDYVSLIAKNYYWYLKLYSPPDVLAPALYPLRKIGLEKEVRSR